VVLVAFAEERMQMQQNSCFSGFAFMKQAIKGGRGATKVLNGSPAIYSIRA